jgi:hypothetical protein
VTVDLAGRPRWQGKPGRLEVHYLTATDPSSGTGLWLHHELVAPTAGKPYAHGWVALFPVAGAPRCERFGPTPAKPRDDGSWFRSDGIEMTSTTARGAVGELSWDLSWPTDSAPLWTFPRWVWQRQLLPAAQVLPTPTTHISGTIGGSSYDGPAGVAHIYGHGNAQRWIWLHCELGGGDVLEVVAATARRPGMRVLPLLPLVQLRSRGRDWPRDPLAAAPLFRAHVDGNTFRIRGLVGTRRLRVDVALPSERCVVLDYTDPDGAAATCTNTERADAQVTVERLGTGGWKPEREWTLDGTAHAEIGTRP